MVLGFRPMRYVMSNQLLSPWLNILFHFKLGAVFFDFECSAFAKSHFELQLFSHFWNVNEVFSTGRLVDPFNGLLTFFIFLACYLKSFLYKGMLLPSFIHWGKCSTFSFFLLLSRFFFFFTSHFFVPICFFSCKFFYVLWDLFPDKIFCCLFLFCSTVSLIFGFWHQTLHWCSWRIDAIPSTCLWSYTGFCLGN